MSNKISIKALEAKIETIDGQSKTIRPFANMICKLLNIRPPNGLILTRSWALTWEKNRLVAMMRARKSKRG